MERSSIKLMAAAMLISAMLTGCGAKDDAQSADSGQAANQGASSAQTAAQGSEGSASGPQQPDRTADFFAKVVKVSGDAIVVQKSTMSPADMPSFGGGRGGQRPQGGDGAQGQDAGSGGQRGNWQGGNRANGDGAQGQSQTTGADGQNGSGAAGGGQGQSRGSRQGGRGGFMNQMAFEDAQTTVPVNADTEIVKFGRGENGMTTDTMKASDLQAGDILTVWLGSDNKTAQYIRLQFNPANMGNTGKAGNGQ